MPQAYDAALRAAADLYAAGDLGGAKEALERLIRTQDAERARLYLGWVRRCLRISASAATPTHAAAPAPAQAPLLVTSAASGLRGAPPPSEISLLDLDEEPGEGLLDLSALLAESEAGRSAPPLVESSAPPPSPSVSLPLTPAPSSSGLSALFSDTPLAERGRSELSLLLSDTPLAGPERADPDPAPAPASSLSGLLSDVPNTASAAGGISTKTAPPRREGPVVPMGPSVQVAEDLILDGELDEEPVVLAEAEVETEAELEFEEAPPSVIEIGDEEPVFVESLLHDAEAEITQEGPAAPPEIAAEVPQEKETPAPAPAPRFLEILHPLDASPRRAGATPDFAVEFEDIVATDSVHLSGVSPGSPMSFPPPPPRSSVDAVLEDAHRHVSRGDRQGALRLLEQVLRDEAGGDPGAPSLRPYQARLAGLYESLLGPLDRVARAGRLPRDLEPSSAFLLSLLDGSMTLEEALMVSGLDRLRGARTLALLIERGLIKIG